MKKFLLIIFLCIYSSFILAQSVIKGQVVDDLGNGVPGVTVMVKGTTVGTTSDTNGYFIIKASKGSVLIFSFIGMSTKEISVNEDIIASSDQPLKINLNSDYHELLEETGDEKVYKEEKKSIRIHEIHEFPFPPPKSSSTYVFSDKLFESCKFLNDVDQIISQALIVNGYSEKSYFSVPNGYALVTRIEKYNDDGTSVGSAERWKISPFQSKFTISNYLKALLIGSTGKYRVIVFIITDASFHTTNVDIKRKDALAWLKEGNLTLPVIIGNKKFSKDHQVISLIYEFLVKDNLEPLLSDPGALTGQTHLLKSNILPCLEINP